jgi:hypothetical protein
MSTLRKNAQTKAVSDLPRILDKTQRLCRLTANYSMLR